MTLSLRNIPHTPHGIYLLVGGIDPIFSGLDERMSADELKSSIYFLIINPLAQSCH